MTLNQILAISDLDSFSVTVQDETGKSIDSTFIRDANYTGPFFSKSHKETWKKNKDFLKAHGDYEVVRMTNAYGLSFYLMKNA